MLSEEEFFPLITEELGSSLETALSFHKKLVEFFPVAKVRYLIQCMAGMLPDDETAPFI